VSGGGGGSLLVSLFNMKWRCSAQAGVVEEFEIDFLKKKNTLKHWK
jgi:hypothetical protein